MMLAASRKRGSPADRLFRNSMPEPNSGCWLWTGFLHPTGYAKFRMSRKPEIAPVSAHRASWLIHRGDIPEGILVCHKCDTRSCINPDHLFLGTYHDNMQDAARKGRMDWKPGRPQNDTKGIKHPCARLTDDDVRSIRSDPSPRRDIAVAYGLSIRHVGRIINRQSWGHIQ